jgi:hypothetical protein
MSENDLDQSNELQIGIIDEPNPKGGIDTLEIKKHADALTNFIKYTATPLTIGIQGEWGSGKTSLLNSIYNSLEQEEGNIYLQIWINSWEHSLLSSPEETLIKIINEILNEMLEGDVNKKRREEIQASAGNILKGALRVGAAIVGGSEGGKEMDKLLGDGTNSIKDLRENLIKLATDIKKRPTNPYQKIVVYVDDLDRIEPKDAVQILELLKNVFSIPNCVFVLAIDYQVVVKGLKDKFGERTEENEWEFRAFFDKIIQLPFMMPMSQYSIGKYVGDLLKQIAFIDNEEQDIEAIELVTANTIGGNPRSLKRLVNSLALIKIFSKIEENPEKLDEETLSEQLEEEPAAEMPEEEKDEDLEDTKDLLLFSLVCLQIAYPKIYDLLIENPEFTSWDDDFAIKITQGKEKKNEEQFNNEFKLATKALPGKDFDEIWEQVLFKICYPNPRYKARAIEISRFFSYLKDDLLKNYENRLKELITEVLNATAVTSISSSDEAKPREIKPGQKVIFKNPDEGLKEYFEKNRWDRNRFQEIRELVKYIDSDLQKLFKKKGYWVQYSRSNCASFYCIPDNKKSKIGGFEIYAGGKHVALVLYRDPTRNWKKPYINDMILAKNVCAVTNFRAVERYKLIIPSKTEYDNAKTKIYELIKTSEEAFHLSKKKIKKYILTFKDGSAYNPKSEKWPNKKFQMYVDDNHTYIV